MKKLLLILFCLPLLYSCNKKQKKVEKKPLKENVTSSENLAYISATILIENKEEATIVDQLVDINDIDNERIILKSYSLTAKTLKSLGRDTSLAKDYIDKLNIRQQDNSNVLRISLEVDTSMANEMVEYLNKLIKIYTQNQIEAEQLFYKNKIDDITKSISIVYDSLSLLENQRIDYQNKRIRNNKYNIICKNLEYYEEQYTYFLMKLEEAKIVFSGITPRVKIIDPAIVIIKNRSMNKNKSNSEKIDYINKINDLKESGIITNEEFKQLKNRIIKQ